MTSIMQVTEFTIKDKKNILANTTLVFGMRIKAVIFQVIHFHAR